MKQLGTFWSTLREIDVGVVRDEAERSISIIVVGHPTAAEAAARLLSYGPDRYPSGMPSPVVALDIAAIAAHGGALSTADLIVVAIDARAGLREQEAAAFAQLPALRHPVVVVALFAERLLAGSALPPEIAGRVVFVADSQSPAAAAAFVAEVLRRLPSELHLAAARRLPGLRDSFARDLIASTSFSNASYALASGLPEQIPGINIGIAAADMLVLTKNQAMLVYRLALAFGAPPDFQARIAELLPVIGGAFFWRQAARSLIGLIPVWGLLPKVAVAYGGTYTSGVAAWRWYQSGQLVDTGQLRQIMAESMRIGRERAAELIDRGRKLGERGGETARRRGGTALDSIRRRLPGAKAKALPPPPADRSDDPSSK